ncbi:MAG: DUF1073 domain-containing protein, partial [Planctomycetes bacterium]|nr:DUF1073 domain-containing protein [Planctomycetota bacterium]
MKTRSMRSSKNPVMRFMSDILQRAGLAERLGQTFGGSRDLYDTFGYRDNPSFDDYLSYYQRGDIAAKIIDIPPRTTWRHSPIIRSDSQEFIDGVAALNKRLSLFHWMQRVDEIGGIGQFGLLLFGTRGAPIDQPPGRLTSPEDLIYLNAFHQGSVEVGDLVDDSEDPRYNQPESYKVTLAGTTTGGGRAGATKLPWQRVLHVAENPVEGTLYGRPRLQAVLNRIDDLNKVLGGAAELYWQNVGGIWHADLSPDVAVEEGDLDQFEDDFLEARHGLTRLIQTRGMTLKTVSGEPIDPTGAYKALIQVITAAAEIPERVLFGSERGQLAGDQDQKEWQARIATRQQLHAEPKILRPTLERLQSFGILPEAEWEADWPPLDSPSTIDRADTAQKFADAISKVAPEGAPDLVMPP